MILFVLSFSLVLFFLFVFWMVEGMGTYVGDPNKAIPRTVLSGGGIPVLSGVILMYLFLARCFSGYSNLFLAISLSTAIGLVLGLIDDYKEIRIWWKVPLMLIPPIPLVLFTINSPLWAGTQVLWIDFGILYWIMVVPIAYMGFSNGSNIIAGYDGLEAGVYMLILLLYIVIGMVTSQWIVLFLSIPLFSALLAFEIYNIPPSKILMGNVGSFSIGGILGIIPLIGHFEIVLPIVFTPHLVEFFFKIKYRGRTSVFGIVDFEGIIHRKYPENRSVLHWIISWGNMNEKRITLAMLAIEAFLCILAFAIWLAWTSLV